MNVSIGLLGHVDSGKTALARQLSTTLSTAALDKHPESQRRGITLDIGISQFTLEEFNITIIDCPGHASFLRSVLAGASIIQILVLLVDLTKGVQIQTIEALIIAEALELPVIVVLNKFDLESDNLDKIQQSITTLATKIGITQIQFCKASAFKNDIQEVKDNILQLLNILKPKIEVLYTQLQSEPVLFHFDHHFPSKTGTILTGTLLSGVLTLQTQISSVPGSQIINNQFEKFSVKSIQSFKKPLTQALPGDRIGIFLNQAQITQERGICCQSDKLKKIRTIYAKIRYLKSYKNDVKIGTIFTVNFGTLQEKARVYPVGPIDKKTMTKIKDGVYKPKKYVEVMIIFDSEINYIETGRILGIRNDFCLKTNQSTSRIAFVGDVQYADEKVAKSIQYEQERLYKCLIDKIMKNQLIIKKIDGIGEKSVIGMKIYQGDLQVGQICSIFGQGKWKADLNDGFKEGEDVFIKEEVMAEWKTGVEE